MYDWSMGRKRKPQREPIERKCDHCEQTFILGPQLAETQIAKRRFCSLSCAAKGRWVEFAERGFTPAPRKPLEPLPNGEKRTRPGRTANAIARYNANPRHCKGCGAPIPLGEGQVPADMKERTFCTTECSNSFRRAQWAGTTDVQFYNPAELHDQVRLSTLAFTKLKDANSNKSNLHRHSQRVYRSRFPENICEYCGRKTQTPVDVAHIRPVSSFSPEDTFCTISQISNLIGLDQICHREFDRGIIPLEEIQKKVAARKPRP